MNRKFFGFAVFARCIGLRLCFILVFFGIVAILAIAPNLVKAQESASLAATTTARIEMHTVGAVSDGQSGALIEWQSNYEIGNLGYNVYRLGKRWGRGTRINQGLVPGSAFIVGQLQPLYGNSGSFFDPQGTLNSQYLIEAVLLDGARPSFVVATSYDADMPARTAGRNLNQPAKDVLANAQANSELLGQRESPATIETKTGDLSPQPRIEADSIKQRWVAAQPGLKFAIKTNGLYRITRQMLADNGFDASVPTANWQLYTDGVEQTMLFTGDNNGGVLDVNGYLEFYGFGVDKLYTDTQVFYLVVGPAPGKRMTKSGRTKIGRVTAPSFQTVAQCRTSFAAQCNKPTEFTSDIRNNEAENFFGDVILNAPVNVTINTPAVDTSAAQAIVDVSVQGFSLNPPTHSLTIFLNNTSIGTISGAGQNLMRGSFVVPAALLQEGANIVRLSSTVNNSVTLVDRVRISYARRYAAINNKLLFTTAYNRVAQVDNFTDASIRVFDVSDQNNVSLANNNIVNNGGVWTVSVSSILPRLMYAVTEGAVMTPAAITPNVPSNFYDTALNKDLVIVTYKDWQTQANALAAYRQNQGLTVAVVNVEDVFDEFSFGASTPTALRAFFARSLPHYALLLGDATQDARNYLSTTPNFVPTTLIDSNYGEIASDEIMGDFSVAPGGQPCSQSQTGDCVADFPIGRLSARNAAQAQTLIDKIISFEQTVQANETFSRGAFFVNDFLNGYNFAATNQALATRLPLNTPVQFTGAIPNPTSAQLTQIQDEIVARINQGPFIVGYAGHGSNTGWSFPNIFPAARVQSLTNGNRLSIFLFLTCLNGAFADFRNDPSIAENLMRNPNGGAAAVWASSGLTVAPGQDVMANHFYDLHRQANAGARIGDLVRESKLETSDNDVRASWVLFGDPTLKIK